jgi:hemerythrin-like domain-containing protein
LTSTHWAVEAKRIQIYEPDDGIDMPVFNKFRSFEILDTCHQKIHIHLDELATLSQQVSKGRLDYDVRIQAEEIETFFSTTARNHHAMEEDEVFPCLLISESTETVAKVRDLIEDHFWIEKYWQDLSPLLKCVANGMPVVEGEKFAETVKLFHELCSCHIESEESMIYPQAKAVIHSMHALNATN